MNNTLRCLVLVNLLVMTTIAGFVLPTPAWRAAAAAEQAGSTIAYEPQGKGLRWLVGPDLHIKSLVERENFGTGDVEVAELYLPKVAKSKQMVQGFEHTHQSAEIFYVISGRLGNTVNGTKHVIEPGMIGIVQPGDRVIHTVEGDEPVKALVIWIPGGEVQRILAIPTIEEQAIGELLAE